MLVLIPKQTSLVIATYIYQSNKSYKRLPVTKSSQLLDHQYSQLCSGVNWRNLCPRNSCSYINLVHGLSFWKKKRIGHVTSTSDLLYMKFIYYAKHYQQGFSRLSNWFPLWCFGPWMSHLSLVWWSTFRFRFLIVICCENCIWWRGNFSLIYCLHSCFIQYQSFTYHFSSQIYLLSNSFFLLITLYWHFP